MDAYEGQADDKAAEGTMLIFRRSNSEDRDDENGGKYDLNDQACGGISADAVKTIGSVGAGHIGFTAE